ncbi:protein hairless-like isoform X1 [Thrips palmi]|uniref:Protein hairless-like isoform X1 n=1 Tax=Thrips palmi TaxID=161013 RepID=A0A6P8ZX40_THRPL|nr:protein hairless-like isoform X1 [Thrips palmi]XP_034249953.1 protein hairless-like isoform X1 [Thrips palmi]
MRIQEKIEASATCAKMTEEQSVNGVCEVQVPVPAAVSKRPRGYVLDGVRPHPAESDSSHAFAGGRLKFFKDGKSILELSYRRDGDRMCWVSNWPVPGAPRQESSAPSLSVSDDNSSIQSSPWQRDHSFKQASPRRGRGAHLQFLMRPLNAARRIRRLSFLSRSIRRKRRRPYDAAEAPLIKEEDADDSFNSSISSMNSSMSKTPSKGKLPNIVQSLIDRVKTNETSRPIIPSGRVDPNIVSPRKRILRELERVSIDEGNISKQKKSRISQGNGSASTNNSTVTCHTLHPVGVPPPVKTAASSYSITSLLAPREDEPVVPKDSEPSFLRNLLKSPSSQTGSDASDTNNKVRSVPKSGNVRKMSPPRHQPVTSPTLSPSPGLRSPAIPAAVGGAAHYAPYMPTPLIYPHYMSPHPASNPYYSGFAPPHSPGPPLWIPYMSSLQRAALFPGLAPQYHSPLGHVPWAPLNHQPHLDDIRKDDDMPLNLSKHAG